MRERLAKLVALGSGIIVVAMALLFGWQQSVRMDRLGGELDPRAWAELYPLHVRSHLRGEEHSSGKPTDRLAANPFRQRAWAGNAFSLEYNAARSHHYAQIDQQDSRRTQEREQPAGCINCHAAETPELVERFGWDALHAMSYNELRDEVHFGSSCLDCHDPKTMELRITRPALRDALLASDIDPEQASRQDMRSYVCAQCHVEYYFEPAGNRLTLPWAGGRRLEDIEQYYDDIGFSDWTHAETGAGLIKVQHPNFELHNEGIHAARDIACADCHMPQVKEGGVQISDHWIRSPMAQPEAACMNCHQGDTRRLIQRTADLQQNTRSLLDNTETALSELMDAIVAARNSGADDQALREARQAHRRAQLRWDFIDADASKGFHAGQEAVRLLSEAIDMAHAGRDSARQAQD
ncbi:MAG: ammonia-forming cytochrome c nitrite reductase subunit c552 [Pseudohongiellaceae bacterium]